jgi:putative SOS response-associated peptidase YedK
MATFEFWYDETYTFKAWFEAESQEEADALIEQVEEGELEITELPKFVNKDKGYELAIGAVSEVTD